VRLQHVDRPDDPRVQDFADLTDVAARSAREPVEGLFIAEGEKVIRRALGAGYAPNRLLMEPKWLPSLARDLEAHDVDVLLADPEVLRSITGYRVHRGALASMRRRPLREPEQVLVGARLAVVLVDLVDHTNVGAAFRNAAALGVDAILVSPGCADPLYRRSVKVSMAAVLSVPWTRSSPDPLDDLAGFSTLALTPTGEVALDDLVRSGTGPRALLLGTEGNGLDPSLARRADLRVRIPMAGGIDSLNVAAATAIALHWLHPRQVPSVPTSLAP
jgi:tRNA G18 (ribose-2'-O)-methylase SpoU